jgi:hypothetical protein
MADRTPRTSTRLSAIRALRLDAWRAPSAEPTGRLLGSLYPILGDFAPPRRIVPVPMQRIAPEVAERRRAS